jgi:hypothetical protein
VTVSHECSERHRVLKFSTGLRAEWAKTRARAARWSEEVVLLAEEMRRVLCFLKWKAKWWIDRQDLRTDVRPDIQEGLVAYSQKQSAILLRMATRFANQWRPTLFTRGLPVDWPSEFLLCHSNLPMPTISADVIRDDEPLPVDDSLSE